MPYNGKYFRDETAEGRSRSKGPEGLNCVEHEEMGEEDIQDTGLQMLRAQTRPPPHYQSLLHGASFFFIFLRFIY